jgi:hypothetical protein
VIKRCDIFKHERIGGSHFVESAWNLEVALMRMAKLSSANMGNWYFAVDFKTQNVVANNRPGTK